MKYEIRHRLKELRRENKLTQKELAKLLNKSETAYASWEQGLSEPSVNDIRLLCKIFDVSSDYLLDINQD